VRCGRRADPSRCRTNPSGSRQRCWNGPDRSLPGKTQDYYQVGVEESRLPINTCDWFDWDLTGDGIYFLNESFSANGRIEFFDFAHGQTTPILALDKPASSFGGLAVSPDGKSLIFGLNELNESYIMLMKNFR
jgi:hypothetical protein